MNNQLQRRLISQSILASTVVPWRTAFGQSIPQAEALTQPAWQKLATEPFKGKQDDLSFVNANTGWYGNGLGKLFQTIDGGATWMQKAHMPGTFIRALGFVDEKMGFMGNVGTQYYPDVTDTHPLYRTNDGGTTWTKVQAEGIDKVKGICGIHILPQQRIYQGEMRNTPIIHAAGRVGGPAYVIRSLDAGANWQVIDVTAQADFILDVHFFDVNNGLLCTSTSDKIEKGEAQMLRTSDGGRSWVSVYRSGRPTENCWKMSFASNRVGYATIQSYDPDPSASKRVVIKTTDAGLTWQELALVDDIKAREFGIGFVSELRGWVGTMTSGFETNDGGRSWVPVNFGRAVNKIRIVQNGATKRVFAIGVDLHRLDT